MVDCDDGWDCPLCMEEMDSADRHFHPCPCGYQICRFCWHKISQDMNKLCPACRREYSEEYIQLQTQQVFAKKSGKSSPPSPTLPMTAAAASVTSAVPCSAKDIKDKESVVTSRRHLANLRVIQKNLVYVIGVSPRIAHEETLVSPEFFGQYGKIVKIVVNKRNYVGINSGHMPSASVYITYAQKEEAARTIQFVDGAIFDGRTLRASYGTTKYCTFFLRGITCQNPGCMYLHEQGEEQDSFTKEEMAEGFHLDRFIPKSSDSTEGSLSRQAFCNQNSMLSKNSSLKNDSQYVPEDVDCAFKIPSLSDLLNSSKSNDQTRFTAQELQALSRCSRTPPPPSNSTFFSFNPFSMSSPGSPVPSSSKSALSFLPPSSDDSYFLSKTAPKSTSINELTLNFQDRSKSTVDLWGGHINTNDNSVLDNSYISFLSPKTSSSIADSSLNTTGKHAKLPKGIETQILSRPLAEALKLSISVAEPVQSFPKSPVSPHHPQKLSPNLDKDNGKKKRKDKKSPTESSPLSLSQLISTSLNDTTWNTKSDSLSNAPSLESLQSWHKQATSSLAAFISTLSPEHLVNLMDTVNFEDLLTMQSSMGKPSSSLAQPLQFTTLERLLLDGLEMIASQQQQCC